MSLPPTNTSPELRNLSEDALAELRAVTEANLPHLAHATTDVTSGARVGGALAAGTPATVLFDAVPCRLVQIRQRTRDALTGDQAYEGELWNLVFRIGIVLPLGALVTVTGVDAMGNAWTRVVRIGLPLHSRTYEVSSRYIARDVNVAGR